MKSTSLPYDSRAQMFHSNHDNRTFSNVTCLMPFGVILCVFVVSFAGAQVPFPEIPDESVSEPELWSKTILPLPPAPDYVSQQSWALNPELQMNQSDDHHGKQWATLVVPKGRNRKSIPQTLPHGANADVFFIHPTMLLEGPEWNADIYDDAMNAEVDHWPIRHQASAFAGAGRVFAPRYRQAHVRIFSLGDSLSWAAAEVAYQDVNEAFKEYLQHWNQGRPIVIAGHSQGAFHGRRLLQEHFDGTPLADQLVAAYLPGMDMLASEFQAIPTCDVPDQTGCLCTWMTYGEGFFPEWLLRKSAKPDAEPLLIVHPVTWTKSERINALDEHLGVVRPSFRLSKPGAIQTWINEENVLWMSAPKLFGGRMFQRDNWHSGDINLFWHNIYVNVQERTQKWHEDVGSNSLR